MTNIVFVIEYYTHLHLEANSKAYQIMNDCGYVIAKVEVNGKHISKVKVLEGTSDKKIQDIIDNIQSVL